MKKGFSFQGQIINTALQRYPASVVHQPVDSCRHYIKLQHDIGIIKPNQRGPMVLVAFKLYGLLTVIPNETHLMTFNEG